MLYLIVAQVQANIKNEAEFLQYAVYVLIAFSGTLLYLCRDSWLSRIQEAVAYAKQVIDIQQKNYELLIGLKASIDALNKAIDSIRETTSNLIEVLNNTQNENLKKQLKELTDLKNQKKAGE
jgi:TolA-binding protein